VFLSLIIIKKPEDDSNNQNEENEIHKIAKKLLTGTRYQIPDTAYTV